MKEVVCDNIVPYKLAFMLLVDFKVYRNIPSTNQLMHAVSPNFENIIFEQIILNLTAN